MWKRVVPIVLVLIVLAYSLLWFFHAGKTEDQAKDFFASLSKDKGVAVTYDSLEVKGYPFEFITAIENPVITLNMAKMVQSAEALYGEGESDQAAQENAATETMRIKGTMAITVNYFTRTIGFDVEGDSEGESTGPEGTLAWKSARSGKSSCSVKLGPQADMSIMQENAFSILGRPEMIVQNFRGIDCKSEPVEIVERDSGEVLFSGGVQSLTGSFEEIAPEDISIELALNSQDVVFSPRWSTMMTSMVDALQGKASASSAIMQEGQSGLGKQNAELKLSYRGPGNLEKLSENQNIRLEVPVFKVSNALYDANLPLNILVSKKGTQFTGEVSLHGAAEYRPEIDAYLNAHADSLANEILSGQSSFSSPALMLATPEQLQQNMRALFPALGAFKTAIATVELSFKGNEDEKMHQPEGEVSVHSIDLKLGEYGFSATGNMVLNPQRGEFALRCHQCHETVEKLIIYINDTQNVVAMIDPTVTRLPQGIAFRDAVAKFVESISTPAEDAAQDRIIQISDSGNGQMVISGRDAQEVMMQAMQSFMPFFVPQREPKSLE